MVLARLLLFAFLASGLAEKCATNKSNSKLFCYYGKLEEIDSCKCTHVILPPNSDVKSIEKLRQTLQGVKILITVHEFNEGLVQLLKSTKVDGLEVNLNKINSKEDIGDFITTAKSKLSNDLVTVVSVPPRADLLAKYYDFKGLSKHTDAFILQTAFLGASKNITFHPSRLSGIWDMQNADTVVDLVTGLGAPLSKLVIAAPVQAFQFKLQNEEHTAVGSPALEVRSITRDELCEKMANSDWTLERDQDQAGPYIFRKDEWIAFDDQTSMDIKAKYARVRGLAGLALKDLSQDGGKKCGGSLLDAAYTGLSRQARAPRGAVLHSLEREILQSPAKPFANIQLSPFRITRIVDVEGKVHTVRQDTRTEFECSRQGYFVHPRSCNRFYRCVKFNQLSEEYNVFEFDCPAGLAFDSKVEVCVWPGSLSDGSACSGSSEIAPVPKERYVCPKEPGYYADPENCRWFFACLDHGESGVMTPYEFRCPFGLVFDQGRLLCEWPWLVPKCGSGYASGTHQNSVQYFGAHGQASTGQYQSLDNYNGIGTLQPVTLNGVSGKIDQSINKVYSSFGNHGPQGYYGNQAHGQGNTQSHGSAGYVLTGSQGFGASSQGFGASSQGFGQNHGSGEATSSQYQTHQGNHGTTHQGSGVLVEAQGFGGSSQEFGQNHASGGATSSHYQSNQGSHGATHQGSGILVEAQGIGGSSQGFGENHASGGATSSQYQSNLGSHGTTQQGSGVLVEAQGFGGSSHGFGENHASGGATSSQYQTHQGNHGTTQQGSGVLVEAQGFGDSSHGFGENHGSGGATSSQYQSNLGSHGTTHQGSGVLVEAQGFGGSSHGFGQNHASGGATSSQYQTHQGNHGTTHQGSGVLVEAQGFGSSSHGFGENHASGGATSSQYQSNQGSHGTTHQGSGILVETQGFGSSSHGFGENHGSGGATSSQYQTHQGNHGTTQQGSGVLVEAQGFGGSSHGFGENHSSGEATSSQYQTHQGSHGTTDQGSGVLVEAQGFGGSSHGFGENHASGGATSSQYQTHQGNHGTTHQGSGILVETQGFGGSSQGFGQNYASGGATSSQYQSNQGSHGTASQGSTQGNQAVLVGTQGVILQQGSAEGYQQGSNIAGLDASNRGSTKYQYHGVESNGEYGNRGSQFDRGSTKYGFEQNSNHGLQAQEGHGVLIGAQDININHGVNTQVNTGEGYQFGSHQANLAVNAHEINNGFSNEGLVDHGSQAYGQQGIKYTNADGAHHQVSFGFGSGGFGQGIQNVDLYVNNQNGGSAYSSQSNNLLTDQKVNIVGGGFSAVKGYGHHEVVTPSTIAVSTGIPTVTSVPLPGTVDLHHTGVVANVPELQVKINSPSEVNIHRGINQFVSTTTAAPEVSTGYFYEKPKVPFVDGQSYSKVEHHQTGYHYEKPSIVFEEKPQKTPLKAVVHNVFGVQTTGYDNPKPSITFKETKAQKPSRGYSYQHFNKAHAAAKQEYIPIVSTQQTLIEPANSYSYQSSGHSDNQQYVKVEQPTHQIVQQPIIKVDQTQPGHSYSYQSFGKAQSAHAGQHVVVQQPILEQHLAQQPIQQGEGHSNSYQNFGHGQKKEYVNVEQPGHHVEVQNEVQTTIVQPAQSFSYQTLGKEQSNQYANGEHHGQQHIVQEVVQPHVEIQKTVVQPAQSFSYQTFGKAHSNQYANNEQQHIVQEVVQPQVEIQKTVTQPVQSFSYQTFGKAHSNQYANTEQQHVVQEVVQPQVEIQQTVAQPAQSFSYQTFGKAHSNQYANTEQQHVVEEVVQPQVEIQKTVDQPAQTFSYQTFGKAQSNQYANNEQQHVVQEVVQPQVEIQKTVAQPAQSFSYQTFGKAHSNQYANNEQQHVVQEVVQPQVEIQKTVAQPAQSFSYQTFGKAHSNQYANTEQQHVVQEVVQPQIEIQKTVVQPAHTYSYQSFGKTHKVVKPIIKSNVEFQSHVFQPTQQHVEVQKQPAQTYSYVSFGKAHETKVEQPLVQQEVIEQPIQHHVKIEQPIQHQTIVEQPVVIEKQEPAHSYSYFGTHKQNHKYVNVEQPIQQETYAQQPDIHAYAQGVEERTYNQGNSYSYQSFGAKEEQVQPEVAPQEVLVSSTVKPVEYHQEQEGYHYPQPLEPVKEEPFVAKKAYVTGQSYYHQKSNLLGSYSLSENGGGYVSSTPAYEETYVSSTPKYQEPTQEIFYQSTPEVLIDQTKKPIYVQTTPRKLFVKTAKQTVYLPSTEASYYLSSTPAPTYQSTLNTLVDKEPLKFYLYDSRLSSKSSTVAPEIISSTYKPLKTLKSSRPIARYEFSSLDGGYEYSSTPVIEVTSQRRKPTRPSNAYLPVKVTTTPYFEVTTPIVKVTKPPGTYLPSVGTAGQIIENYQSGEYQAGEYEDVVSRRPVKVVKVVRPAKSKAIVKINDFHPMLSAKLGAQCTCVSNTVSLKKNPIQVENYSIDDGDDGYIVDNPEYDTQKIVEITPASEIISSTPSVVIRKRVKARPTTVSYEETPVTKAAEYFIKSTRKPIQDDDEPSDVEVKQAVKTVKKLVKAAAKQGAKEGTKEALKDFDRYGPGGVRSRIETLQGIDCKRAGLFRHPSQCNKFYSCRWDCDKNKFTLHVFNCPVHLTFDSNLGACNWPSQGPACSGNTLLPSD